MFIKKEYIGNALTAILHLVYGSGADAAICNYSISFPILAEMLWLSVGRHC
jgi:hypothetical protein